MKLSWAIYNGQSKLIAADDESTVFVREIIFMGSKISDDFGSLKVEVAVILFSLQLHNSIYIIFIRCFLCVYSQ